MATSKERRIAKELMDIRADKDSSGVYAAPIDENNLLHLKGSFPAPPDTPYAGGHFQVDIKIPDSYPFKSPIIKFDTKVWHPNISSQTGAICLDTLGSGWSPVQTIKTALLSLRMLLEFPNPKDPQDAEVAKMMNDNPEGFARKAHEWAVKHAGAPPREFDTTKWRKETAEAKGVDADRYKGYNKELIDRFVNMGFEVDAVVDAFMFVGIDNMDGQDYELEEAYMGDITARLLGEN
ncbi:ubiquitin-conjugating enzyme [Colletotrichum musicola]|uniref:Ubiquitin-conjugating enzyme E2 2 n=3 Tax=Colletotrichum orchidearum species complex TaxID=2707337 RepID=A0A8H6KRY0_9PEZI|nr:ubiquitin-conjugating enzyme [Colletotrichum sojae]KAF6815270.1 ubiquitin-conjugating enzyme [Colletotrichum plurivorum]KAF6836203.1 ubiquitin-conjugating enzyme [Colletotrichum musicola]